MIVATLAGLAINDPATGFQITLSTLWRTRYQLNVENLSEAVGGVSPFQKLGPKKIRMEGYISADSRDQFEERLDDIKRRMAGGKIAPLVVNFGDHNRTWLVRLENILPARVSEPAFAEYAIDLIAERNLGVGGEFTSTQHEFNVQHVSNLPQFNEHTFYTPNPKAERGTSLIRPLVAMNVIFSGNRPEAGLPYEDGPNGEPLSRPYRLTIMNPANDRGPEIPLDSNTNWVYTEPNAVRIDCANRNLSVNGQLVNFDGGWLEYNPGEPARLRLEIKGFSTAEWGFRGNYRVNFNHEYV